MAREIDERRAEKLPTLPDNPEKPTRELLDRLLANNDGEPTVKVRTDLQETMMNNVSVFRTDETLSQALEDLKGIRQRAKKVVVQDKGKKYNTDLMDAFEIDLMVDYAETVAALERTTRSATTKTGSSTRSSTASATATTSLPTSA